MKLELKYLASYLPYGLKVQLSQVGIFNLDEEFPQPHNEICEITNILKCNNEWQVEISEIAGDNTFGLIDLDEISPILFPMSLLYTEMEYGKVPIVELAKMATGIQNWEVVECQPTFGIRKIKFKPYLIAYDKEYNSRFFFINKDFYLYDVDGARECTHQNQLDLFTYLFENHFDVYGLIDKGLAIDKTKIK